MEDLRFFVFLPATVMVLARGSVYGLMALSPIGAKMILVVWLIRWDDRQLSLL